MLRHSAMRAAACCQSRTPCCLGQQLAKQTLGSVQLGLFRAQSPLQHSSALAPTGTPAVVQQHHRTESLRCHSNAQASSSAPEAPAGPRKLKYNLRPLTKDDVDYTFARSGGAGGQNVNKVNTKVDMRFELDKAGWIPDDVKDALRRAEKNRFTKEGVLVLTSTRHRTQSQNLDDCLSKLQVMIDDAVEAVTPKEIDPETVKRVKAAIKAGNERRLDTKKKDSKKKAERRRRDYD